MRGKDSRLHIALTLILLGSHPGCRGDAGSPLPKTYPLDGEVVDKDGQRLTSGAVEFVLISNPKVRAVGNIQPNGTFTVMTEIDGSTVAGAMEGGHEVTFLPDTRGQLPFYFDQPFNVQPGENHCKLTYPYAASRN